MLLRLLDSKNVKNLLELQSMHLNFEYVLTFLMLMKLSSGSQICSLILSVRIDTQEVCTVTL